MPGLTEGSMLAGSIGFALGLAAVAATATCAASAIKRIAAAVVILREVVAMEHLQWAEGDQGWERTAEEVAHRARQAQRLQPKGRPTHHSGRRTRRSGRVGHETEVQRSRFWSSLSDDRARPGIPSTATARRTRR